MSSPMPVPFEIEDAVTFLDAREDDYDSLERIGAGYFSVAFRYRTGAGRFVFRAGMSELGFLKDQYAGLHFSGEGHVVPPQIEIGPLHGLMHYAICPEIDGLCWDKLELAQRIEARDALLEVRLRLNALTPPGRGWGFADATGRCHAATHIEGLLDVDTWHLTCHRRADQTLTAVAEVRTRASFPNALWDQALPIARARLDGAPRTRDLVHGDFGFDNMLYRDGAAVGVLDWAEWRAGSRLEDLASVDMYDPEVGYIEAYHRLEPLEAEDRKRIRGYQLGHRLSHVWGASMGDNAEDLAFYIAKVEALL